MRFTRNRHVVATIIAASCVALTASVEASASAVPATFKTDAASGWAGASRSTDRSDAAQSGLGNSSGSTDRTDAAQAGTDAANRVTATTAFPPAGFRGGDTPVDHPGASRAPSAVPTTIEIVRPERTIVRNVDEALPLILSGTALLLVLAGLAMTMVHGGLIPRPGRSH